MNIGTIWQAIVEAYTTYGSAVLQIIGGAAAIATITPNKLDDTIFSWLYKAINFVGMNFGQAKNANTK